MKILLEPQELIVRYVERMTQVQYSSVTNAAVGLVNNEDELLAGAVFNGYAKPNICMHIAGERFTPAFIAALCHYAFVQAECTRITGYIDEQNLNSRRFAEHLGAKQEGVMLRALPSGGNICIYGLQVEDAKRWLKPRYMHKLVEAVA